MSLREVNLPPMSHITAQASFLVLGFNHSNEIKPSLIDGSFILQESNPTMISKVIKKSYDILIFMITKYKTIDPRLQR